MNKVKIDQYPILKILNGDFNIVYDKCAPLNEFGQIKKYTEKDVITITEIRSFLKTHLSEFKKNIFFISDPFITAVNSSSEALNKALKKDSKYVNENLKYNTGVCLRKHTAIFYHYDIDKQKYTAVAFHHNELLMAISHDCIMPIDYENDIEREILEDLIEYRVYISNILRNRSDLVNDIMLELGAMLLIMLFRTFADHEVKVVPGKVTAKLNETQYTNTNKTSILVLDSSWYTSLVRTEGFMVTGHLRMQACGKNLSERRLVYIDSFQKYGYVRKAKMLPTEVDSISEILN